MSLHRWNYNLVILETLLFKFKKILNLMRFKKIEITQEQRDQFVLKVFNPIFY
jgi:hypothetical protein